jgi:hypothetical protein
VQEKQKDMEKNKGNIRQERKRTLEIMYKEDGESMKEHEGGKV